MGWGSGGGGGRGGRKWRGEGRGRKGRYLTWAETVSICGRRATRMRMPVERADVEMNPKERLAETGRCIQPRSHSASILTVHGRLPH